MTTNNECPVCYDTLKVCQINPCNHKICYECFTKMEMNQIHDKCPICRQPVEDLVHNVKTSDNTKNEICNRMLSSVLCVCKSTASNCRFVSVELARFGATVIIIPVAPLEYGITGKLTFTKKAFKSLG